MYRRSILTAIAGLSVVCFRIGCDPQSLDAPVVLHFREEVPSGWLVWYPSGMPLREAKQYAAGMKEAEKYELLMGRVEIPAGKKVFLFYMDNYSRDRDAPVDLSPLDQFHPDHLDVLIIPASKIIPEEAKHLRRHRKLRLLRFGPLSEATSACLAPVGDLQNLRELILGDTDIGDDGLAYLRSLSSLEVLELQHTDVTDLGLRHLTGLKSLRQIELVGTKAGDQGMFYLAELPKLAEVSVSGTSVGDRGLKALSRLKNLRRLALMGTRVTSDGLTHLTHLPSLRVLGVSGERITNAAGERLAQIPSLRRLSIKSEKFGDEGLQELHVLEDLELLEIRETVVTEQGVEQFRSAVPGCKVYSDFDEP